MDYFIDPWTAMSDIWPAGVKTQADMRNFIELMFGEQDIRDINNLLTGTVFSN